MYIAHIGLAVFILGVAVSDSGKKYFEGILLEGQEVKVAQYTILFEKVIEKREKNWIAEKGQFLVSLNKKNIMDPQIVHFFRITLVQSQSKIEMLQFQNVSKFLVNLLKLQSK